ncbi:MAG: filamentous hemagglutinin family protein [Chthoniobacter sp.]|nr:filamentous hemagglutinin family protein [Chthoniobacter sp.]
MKCCAPAPRSHTSEELWRSAALLGLSCALLFSANARAGDLLRGGAAAGARSAPTAAGPNPVVTAQARKNAADTLARTTEALKSVQAMQTAALAAALAGPNHLGPDPNHPGQLLPAVPNGLAVGGLQVAPGVPANLAAPQVGENATLWTGAALPTQTTAGGRTLVTVKQQAAQAILNWKTLNVGKETTLKFDQSAGGANKSQWIAFNKISDPSGSPTQILGRIEGEGQAYIINQNGILFGGSSQVNLRSLTASSLPINDNLIKQGLLNNRDAQFLFSALEVPGGADGTPTFTPPAALTPSGQPGDVVVKAGAQLNSGANTDGNGGRVMLVGANVRNEGTISTPAGQTILAAGLQVAVAGHTSTDPSLRGLDAWVGAVGESSGTATNSGLIQATTGSALLTGRSVNQLGAIESTTSVTLNGRIDLLASYGAVGNPSFDNADGGGPPFLFQKTGVVTFGSHSSTRILPEYANQKAVPGTTLPERSQINVDGQAVHLQPSAMILAPNGRATMRAGTWAYAEPDGNRTTLQADGTTIEDGLFNHFTGSTQRFLFSGGQIYLDHSSFISVAGSADVAAPLEQSILNIALRGSEFADSPVQRQGALRGVPLTVDIRRTGVSGGRYWMGTPLGDVTGLAGLIANNAAQLTTAGGDVSLQSGGSIVVQSGATIDVSGGFFQHTAGVVKTSRLLQNGHLVEIHDALPGEVYDSVYTGTFTVGHSKYGVTETYTVPWMTGERYEPAYTRGADGGTLKLTAASMAIDGQLRGATIEPPRGWTAAPSHSTLALSFGAERTFGPSNSLSFLPASPTPPAVVFGAAQQDPVAQFVLAAELPASRRQTVVLSPDLVGENGFGHLVVESTDGEITVPDGTELTAPALGSISLAGANVRVKGRVSAPGGKLSFQAYTLSPAFAAEFQLTNPGSTLAPLPLPDATRGRVTLEHGARLSAAGLVVDDRDGSPARLARPLAIHGGSIVIEAFDADLKTGGMIDVSGGAVLASRGAVSYGNAGSITIRTGKDPGAVAVIGGKLQLGSTLAGFSGKTGGSLTVQTSLIQIGGTPKYADTLLLQPDFFRSGGFASYALEAIGAPSAEPFGLGEPKTYAPAIVIAPGTVIEPVAESWIAQPHVAGSREIVLRPMLKPSGQRTPVSLSLTATGADDLFTTNLLEVRGDLVMGAGARIAADPGAKVAFKGQTVTLLGSVFAPGGTISVAGGSRFAVAPDDVISASTALPTVQIGSQAVLSTAGTAVYLPDAYGRRLGTLHPGGSISIAGNILAQGGAVLDVSGASAVFDVHPTALGNVGAPHVALDSGLTAPLWKLRTVPVRMDSNGGSIELQGAQMLFTDATLLGRAGGPTATGGTLAIFSGRFYAEGTTRTSADINLVVTQNGRTLAATNTRAGVGRAVLDGSGAPLTGMGYFAANRFMEGGFDALDLGAKYLDASPLSFGGNVEFQGPVAITARAGLRVAAGGVIQADAPVQLTGRYVALGQPFRAPRLPDDVLVPFTQFPAPQGSTYNFAPTFGPGTLTVKADLIDLGILSLQNIGRADFVADGGDIRGNGTLQIAGDLHLRAGQIYPTTLATFNVFAYDHAGLPGTVTVTGSGARSAPLSAGGSLNIFASEIVQGGVLRAPQGSITLGWDGTDFDRTTTALDAPANLIAGTTLATPTAQHVALRAGSTTSVAARTVTGGAELLIPFGLSPDGSSWIDPRGVNVTTGGLPEKRVVVAGQSVTLERGATIDLSGGGDLMAFRWTPGIGGGIDLLGTASATWGAGTEYQSGDLVTFGGQTFSARVRNAGQSPAASRYWTLVPDSFAVVPGFASEFAPYAPNNPTAQLLEGEPGYVSSALKLGDRIYLEKTPGLAAGTYTLLPRRYALLPGALLVTPTTQSTYGNFTVPEGAHAVAGYRVNAFSQPQEVTTLRTQFEVAPAAVLAKRAAYADYSGNEFFQAAAKRFDIASGQRLPADAGALALHGNATLQLAGQVLTSRPPTGRGAAVDVSSFADIAISGGGGSAPVGAPVVLDTAVLNSWGAESLLIGGLRRATPDGTAIEVRSNSVVLDNPGATLTAPDLALAAQTRLTVTGGSAVVASGSLSERAASYLLTGDGALLRASRDPGAVTTRGATTSSAVPLITVGAGARVAGASVTLDSSYGTALDTTARLEAQAFVFGSGQISLVLSPTVVLAGSVVPQHLTIAGQLLQDAQNAAQLTLQSYRTIDLYGAGTFGTPNLANLTLLGGGLRGFGQGSDAAIIQAENVTFSNPTNVAGLSAPAAPAGTLQVDARTVRLGAGAFASTGHALTVLNASGGVIGEGTGTFDTPGALTIHAPVITGTRGSQHSLAAADALVLEPTGGAATVRGDLGASLNFTGASITANSAILLPSGQLTLRAKTGSVNVAGQLDTGGVAQNFYDVTRYSSGGAITLASDLGNVNLLAGGSLSVAAPAAGGAAGSIAVNAAQGAFNLTGAQLLGQAATGQTNGSFRLDAGSVLAFDDISAALHGGGFFEQRNVRVRTGSVTIANVGGQASVARDFTVSADTGNILVTGTIDASGTTGGKIVLATGGNLTLANGAVLTAHGVEFSSAGKGGEIRLEAGAAVNGAANLAAMLDVQTGATIDLGVDEYVAGDFTTPGSSAFLGQFTGTLHLRAPRSGNDVRVNAIHGAIHGASSVVVEGYRLYDQASGLLNNPLRGTINTDATNYMNAGYAAMQTKLLSGSPDAASLAAVLVITPGVEIYRTNGDLTLGTAVSGLNTEDWDLSGFRYGPKLAPGVLTLRTPGNLVFNNTLSDGFTPVTASAANGNSTMWLAQLAPIVAANGLPINTQSWSYRLAAGADLSAADFRAALPSEMLAAGKGSILVGEFYAAIPTTSTSGATAAVGSSGITANSIRIATGAANRTRFEVVRTGTGDIEISAGRDVQLRNLFATIYTAGARIPDATTIYAAGDFVRPIVEKSQSNSPGQADLGAVQQNYTTQWSMAGGDVRIAAGGDIGRFTLSGGEVMADSSRQLPTNWLYRRGYVDPATGLFGEGGVGTSGSNSAGSASEASASTTWWIDFSNFFQGFGALGGGDIALTAGSDVINADAVIPTNARMPGRAGGVNLAPDASKLLELGGGDLVVRAGENIDGGVYYVERGSGELFAGGQITTNAARSPSLGLLGSSLQPSSVITSVTPEVFDSATWLPTTLFVGQSHFDVSARGEVLLGPVTNAFLLPQGLNNKFWYKTYFNTFAPTAGATVASFGGDVTHRLALTLPGRTNPEPILAAWLGQQNLFNGPGSGSSSSNFQPWIRLAETDVSFFSTQLQVAAPNLFSTAFAGDVNIVGNLTLFPSATGTVELAATGGIVGLQPSGRSRFSGQDVTVWTSATVNLSDADPANAPGIATPLAYQTFAGRSVITARQSNIDPFGSVDPIYEETGSYSGVAASIVVQDALHARTPLHAADPQPTRIYATGGDITGLSIFSSKHTIALAERDITDVAFYIQNVQPADISVVAAGRDVSPNNPNATLRATANELRLGNLVGDSARSTSSGSTTNALPGDLQINGPGVLEVFAGRHVDLGTEANLTDGTGVGITSIGGARNPSLPFGGADLIVMAGVGGMGGRGPALGLSRSALDFTTFVTPAADAGGFESAYLLKLGLTTTGAALTDEQQTIVGLERFYRTLRDAGRGFATAGNYAAGDAAVTALFGAAAGTGEISTRARDIRTTAGGTIALAAAGGGVTMASDIFGNPLTPPGIVTEFGGAISIFTDQNVDIGQARIFTLRGGDIVIWSTEGDIAAGTSPKTVVTAPPTRVLIDTTSADVKTDLGGLATGGGIGVLASVEGVAAGDVDLVAQKGVVDAGDAGIRSTGNLNIAASAVLNASNIQVAGTSAGVPTAAPVAAPNIGAVTQSNPTTTTSNPAAEIAKKQQEEQRQQQDEKPSLITVEVLGYGGE